MGRRSAVAPRWAQWEVSGKHASIPGVGFAAGGAAPLPGAPILNRQFANGSLRLVVEFAFGANLMASPSTWAWTDVTTDVMIADGRKIQAQLGKQDARSTAGPARLMFTLDNRTSKYSKSPMAAYWPNVKRGVPVRCRVIFNQSDPALSFILFQGRAAGFQPGFATVSGSVYATVAVTAAGAFRQLGQGSQPLLSTMRQYLATVSNLVGYWPMEDPSGAFQLAGGTAATQPMAITGTVTSGSNSTAVCSDALPVFDSGSAIAWFPPYTGTGAFQMRALVLWPAAASALPDQTVVFRLYISNSAVTTYDVLYVAGGSARVIGYSGTISVFDSGAIALGVDGTSGQIGVSLTTSGSDVALQLSYYAIGASSAVYSNQTVTGQLVGVANHVQLFPDQTVNSTIAVGHLTLQSQASDIFETAQPLNAYDGEFSYDRVTRLLGLAGYSACLPVTDGASFPSRVGPQRIDSVLNLIREAEATDGGVLYDGHSDSLTFPTHLVMENLTAAFTVDATTQLMPPFPPVDDDQQLRNQWTISQRDGPQVTYTNNDTSDPNSAPNVGLYSDSATINVFSNANPEVGTKTGAFGTKAQLNLASWMVHRDTPDGYRIPQFQIAIHRNPELLGNLVANLVVGLHRMDVTNLSSVYPQMPPWTHQYMIVGWTHSIDQFLWDVTVNVIPYEPWHVGVLAQPSGDTGVNVMRLDTVGSSLAAGADAGATTLSVSSTDKGLWTTVADDFPFQIKVGGIPVTVTNITGASSPQTFTVDPTTVIKSLAVGSDVRLWNPPVLAIGGVS